MLAAIDMAFGVRDGRIRLGPGESDFKQGEGMTADDDGLAIRAPDAGVPQALSGLEGLDVIAFVERCHVATPRWPKGPQGITKPRAKM
jgi:hypothetical protein